MLTEHKEQIIEEDASARTSHERIELTLPVGYYSSYSYIFPHVIAPQGMRQEIKTPERKVKKSKKPG